MSDFYPTIVRAIAKLSIDSPQARQEIYDHARKFLITRLSGLEPRASAPEIMREQIALEAAIRRVEAGSEEANQLRGPNAPESPLPNYASFARSSAIRTPSAADHELPDRPFDQGQSEISTGPRPASQSELSKDAAPPPTVTEHIPETVCRGLARLSSTGKIAPRDLSNGISIGMGLPNPNPIRSVEPVNRQKKFKSISAADEIFKSKKFALFDPTIMGLAAIVVMLIFIAVVSINLITIHFPRLVWFSQHLIDDHPMIIAGILISICFTLLLGLPIFGTRRNSSSLRSLRLLFRSMKSG